MIRNRTALFAVSAAWVAVLLTVVLSLLLGEVPVLLALLTGVTALAVTGFWTVRLSREPSLRLDPS